MRFFTAFAAVFFSLPAFGWGSFGHRSIATLAERHLCPRAHAAVLRGLEGESMVAASTWADDVRNDSEYAQIRPWHFVDMDLGTTYTGPAPAKGNLVSAIESQQALLGSADTQVLHQALRLVIHFVGDAHQPFHAGAHSDGGANGVQVTWFGKPTSLHHVWDTEMLYEMNLSVDQLASDLENRHYPAPAQLTPEAWVTESSALAKTGYPAGGGTALGKPYYNQYVDVVRLRLWQGGMRLAALLNARYGCN